MSDVLYLDTPLNDTVDPRETLEPYLERIAPSPLFTSYHLTHNQIPSATSSDASTRSDSPVIGLIPYAGCEGLTEGLDWEAEQGRKAFEAIMGVGEGVKGFFEKNENEGEEGEEDADELM